MDIFGWVWLANTKISVLDFVSISYPWLHVIFRQGCGGQGNVAYHRQPIWRNTFCNLDEYIQKSWGGEKGEDCTMLHVTVGHYHSRQATSHPKAMRQPHPKSLSKSTIFFSLPTRVSSLCSFFWFHTLKQRVIFFWRNPVPSVNQPSLHCIGYIQLCCWLKVWK